MFEVGRGKTSSKNSDARSEKKTVTRTFRIRAEYDDFLKEEAERRGISINVLMNLILRRSASFDKIGRGYNVISLTKRAFGGILEGIPLEHLALAGEKTGSIDIQNIADMIGLSSNYDSFIYLMSRIFGGPDHAMWFRCYRHSSQNHDFFNLQHNLGRGWSIYLEKYLLSYIKALKIDCEIKVYDHAINIKVLRPH